MMLNLLHCAKVQLWPNRNEPNDVRRFEPLSDLREEAQEELLTQEDKSDNKPDLKIV